MPAVPREKFDTHFSLSSLRIRVHSILRIVIVIETFTYNILQVTEHKSFNCAVPADGCSVPMSCEHVIGTNWIDENRKKLKGSSYPLVFVQHSSPVARENANMSLGTVVPSKSTPHAKLSTVTLETMKLDFSAVEIKDRLAQIHLRHGATEKEIC